MIPSMELSLVYYFSVHSNVLVFLAQGFQRSKNNTSVDTIKLQSLCLHILTFFFFSFLFLYMSVLSACLCMDLYWFLEIFGSFSQFSQFCLGKQTCVSYVSSGLKQVFSKVFCWALMLLILAFMSSCLA